MSLGLLDGVLVKLDGGKQLVYLLHGAETSPRKWRAAELCKVYRTRKPFKA